MRDSENVMKEKYKSVKSDSKLSQKQIAKEISKLESSWTSESAKYNSEIQDIRNMDAKFTERVQQTVFNTVQSIARSFNIDIVLNKWNRDVISVFYNVSKVDITDLVIKKLDETLPETNLEGIRKW
jgi:Skp family chaperone for outer membrane proteins